MFAAFGCLLTFNTLHNINMMQSLLAVVVVALCCCCCLVIANGHVVVAQSLAPLPPLRLRVEHAEQPLGTATQTPRFSWQPQAAHGARSIVQHSYRLQVCRGSVPAVVPACMVWDSGIVQSNATLLVPYNGSTPLTSDSSYTWQVRWCSAPSLCSPYSQLATFGVALLSRSDWQDATWVGGGGNSSSNDLSTTTAAATAGGSGETRLRRVFSVPADGGGVARCRLYVASPSYYVAYAGPQGQRLGDALLGTFTTFSRRIVYDVLNCTGVVVPGTNVLAVALGNGWCVCA